MYNPYQRRRGELQSLGEIISAALRVADPNFYRPPQPVAPRKPRARKKKGKRDRDESDWLQGVQLELNFAASSAITPENPITDEDVPF